MERIYRYAILTAVPDERRGERLNIGILVFLPDRVDVRFSDLSKMRALTGGEWSRYVADVSNRLATAFARGEEPAELVARFSLLEPIIRFSEVAQFSARDGMQYEQSVVSILDALVNRPRADLTKPKSTRINTEIATEFRKAQVLALPGEGISDHKVVRDFSISEEENLRADFAALNGVYHITATLDLRLAYLDIGRAALKAIVLDKARKRFDGRSKCKRFGVYAAPVDVAELKPHIELLSDYSDEVFNWSEPRARKAYTRAIYTALRATKPFNLESS